MLRAMTQALSADKMQRIDKQVRAASAAGDDDAAWAAMQPLLRVQRHQEDAAFCLVNLVNDGPLPIDHALRVLADLHASHVRNPALLGLIGSALQSARDIDFLNAPPPEHPLFREVSGQLAALAAAVRGEETEQAILRGLATAARMLARQQDEVAETSCQRLIELDPGDSSLYYNYGLYLKTRGRFREGMLANQTATSLVSEPFEACEWNLGICATGAGESGIALEVWKRMGQTIEMGRFGLPEGRYPQCKVRLAERPLAERSAECDDPGLEETIWIQRLSPCHGIVRSVLFQKLGVDFGDVVLIDGAPITYHSYDDTQVPVFPHLATLVRSRYRFYDFAGTQDAAGRLADASDDLDADAVVYSHGENFRVLCASCWRDPDIDHEHHGQEQTHVVTGRVAAPPDMDAAQLLQQLDAALAAREPCQIYVPDLCAAAGRPDRAAIERRRFDMLRSDEV